MKQTIYLPDDLGRCLKEHLREHPDETVSGFVQRAVQKELMANEPKDLTPLLELAGCVKGVKEIEYDPERPEDSVILNVRDSRDI